MRKLLSLILVLIPSVVFAQTGTWQVRVPVPVPTAQRPVTGYTYTLTRVADGVALPTQSIGNPTPVGGFITADVTAFFNTLPPGTTYVGTVTAVGPGGSSPSPTSDPFTIPEPPQQPLPPDAPGKPAFIRTVAVALNELSIRRLHFDHTGNANSYEVNRNGQPVQVTNQVTPMPLTLLSPGTQLMTVSAVYGTILYTSDPLEVVVQ